MRFPSSMQNDTPPSLARLYLLRNAFRADRVVDDRRETVRSQTEHGRVVFAPRCQYPDDGLDAPNHLLPKRRSLHGIVGQRSCEGLCTEVENLFESEQTLVLAIPGMARELETLELGDAKVPVQAFWSWTGRGYPLGNNPFPA